MGDFKVHHVKFFEFSPHAIHSMAFSEDLGKLAVARCLRPENADEVAAGRIEIWNTNDHRFQEKVFPAVASIEALIWCKGRLFSGGMDEQLREYNVDTGQIKAGTEGGCVVLFEITANGVEYSRSFSNQGDRILSIAWYDAENVIVTGGIDNVRVWSVHSGQAIRRIIPERASQRVETCIWSIGVTKDFTIVTGDSRGYTCFWDGQHGTQIKRFHAHAGPVFAVCITNNGNSVMTCGADPTLVQFELIMDMSIGHKWVKSAVKSQHTHDVRSLVYTGTQLVSGGVDGQLYFNTVENGRTLRKAIHMTSVPQRPLVQTVLHTNSILLQYPTKVELWALGSTSASSETDGTILDLDVVPSCLVSLALRSGRYTRCSAVSPNAQWIAYSDQQSVRLFHIPSSDEQSQPSVIRVRCLPSVAAVTTDHMVFSHDSSKLFIASPAGRIHVLVLDVVNPTVLKVLDINHGSTPDVRKTMLHCTGLNASRCGRYLSVCDSSNAVHVYRVEKLKFLCSVPVRSYPPTCVAFHPTDPLLLVSYTDRMIIEYNIKHREYSSWSREFSANVPRDWLSRPNVIRSLFYHSQETQKIILYDDELLCVINKTESFPEKARKLFKSPLSSEVYSRGAFHFCQRFKVMTTW